MKDVMWVNVNKNKVRAEVNVKFLYQDVKENKKRLLLKICLQPLHFKQNVDRCAKEMVVAVMKYLNISKTTTLLKHSPLDVLIVFQVMISGDF